MTRHTLTVQQKHLDQLAAQLMPEDGHESVAYLLLGTAEIPADPWTQAPTRRLLSHEVITIDPDDVVSSSGTHIRSRTQTLVRVLARAQAEGLMVGVVHSHPSGVERFSVQDDTDEPCLIELAQNRNGHETELLSLVMTRDGVLFGRVWHGRDTCTSLELIGVYGDRFALHFPESELGNIDPSLHRQGLAFGSVLNMELAGLRIGIVGCGATGSATAMLLARMGVKRFFAIDRDHVEVTNLNRLHGASMCDVEASTLKTDILKRHIEGMGLGAHVEVHRGWAGDAACRDGLRACDIVFGCTDDHDGRLLLNRLAYFYLIPILDMGIKIDLAPEDSLRILDAAGRVTVLMPGTRCLLCRNVVNPRVAVEEAIQRNDPAEYAWRREQQYVEGGGGGGPAPAVVTFTTDVACRAVDELTHRLTGYRRSGSVANWVRKYHLGADKRPGAAEAPRCPICGDPQDWGRGDVEPFLRRVG